MTSPEEIVVAPFEPGYEQQVVGLIVPIQREEFGVAITAEEQPDLLGIPDFYQRGGGNFWLALHGRRVVGTVALLDIGAGQGALRKMFVHRDYRGGPLGEGDLQGFVLHCPLHAWPFDLRTGRCTLFSEARVRVFDVREENGRILVAPGGRLADD